MKKYILFVVAAAAMVACNKSEVPSIDGGKNEADQKYVIYAEDVNTRTVTDASFTVTWTNNDNLAVYTWPAGVDLPANEEAETKWRAVNPVNFVASDVSASPKPFSLSEADSNGSLAVAAGIPYEGRLSAFKDRYGDGSSSLKWGVIYPGKQSNPSWAGYGVIVFGNFELVHSTQNGNDNMDHLAYQDVLWGTATTTAENPVPTISMKHIGTMMEYTVVNKTSSPITVNRIKITVNGAAIGGQYRINVFDGGISEYLLQGSAINTCPLWVDNGAPIPENGSAKFYQVLAPFKLDSGYKITMTVETDKGIWTKTTTLSAAISFESGKRNTATLNVDKLTGLCTHKIDEKWFNTPLGYYLDMVTGTRHDWTKDFKNSDTVNDIDLVVYRGGGEAKNKLVIAAPADENVQNYVDTDIKAWSTKNATTIKKIAVDFDKVFEESELETAYNAANETEESGSLVLAMNETAILKTVSEKFALVKVTGGTRYDNGQWGSCILSLKTVQ